MPDSDWPDKRAALTFLHAMQTRALVEATVERLIPLLAAAEGRAPEAVAADLQRRVDELLDQHRGMGPWEPEYGPLPLDGWPRPRRPA